MNNELTKKQLTYLTDLEERDKCAEALYGHMEVNNTDLPNFDRWTLVDTESCRIYAVFSNHEDITAYITHPMFPTMMEKIIRDRQVAVYASEDADRILRVKLNQYGSIKLMKEDVEVWISHTIAGAPMNWTIGKVGSQWMHVEVTVQKLIDTKFDLDTMRKMTENSDFAI